MFLARDGRIACSRATSPQPQNLEPLPSARLPLNIPKSANSFMLSCMRNHSFQSNRWTWEYILAVFVTSCSHKGFQAFSALNTEYRTEWMLYNAGYFFYTNHWCSKECMQSAEPLIECLSTSLHNLKSFPHALGGNPEEVPGCPPSRAWRMETGHLFGGCCTKITAIENQSQLAGRRMATIN